MRHGILLLSFFATSILADTNLDEALLKADLKASATAHSTRALLDELIALEQADAQANSRSEYGLEFRPRITDSTVGVALRIYLPDRWSQNKLRNQLILVAESEQLRVAALEWRELMAVYRDFCTYRMLQKKLSLLDREIQQLAPYLDEADQSVKLRQLEVSDRARLYSHYLGIVNDREQIKSDFLVIKQQLRFALGHAANLNRYASIAVVEIPARREVDPLLQQALNQRSDYRQFEVQARSLNAAESVARSEDGFRLKYIQPDYRVNYKEGGGNWGLSASFILPWGTRNPDIAVYQQEHLLSLASMNLQRTQIEERLRVLLKTVEDHYTQSDERSRMLKPLLHQLSMDLERLNHTGQLAQLRERLSIRERILDMALQSATMQRQEERIGVDLAEEMGSLVQ